jgi:AraC-like DNA-binding protein
VESTISMLVVRGLLDAVRRAGGDPIRLRHAAGIEADALSVMDGRMARTQFSALCELAVELSGDPALGLHWAERMEEGTFGPVSYALAHSASLRHAVASLVQLRGLVSDQHCLQLVELSGTATVRVLLGRDDCLAVQRFGAEMMVTGLLRLLRRAGPDARPSLVQFEYGAPAHAAEYARVFRCPLAFDRPFTGITLPRSLLDAPAANVDEDVHDLLHALAVRRLQHVTRTTPYALRVRDYLVRERRGQRTEMETVARAFQTSARTLRRHLSAEGRSYNDIATEALVVIAKQLLRDKRRSIGDTARDIGYANLSAFHRAFRRWTGTTPGAYRRAPTEAEVCG